MTAIIISSIICATIIILFISCLVYDYRIKTADIRSVKRFEKAFGKNVKTIYIPNHERTPAPMPESEKTADSGESLDFPNSRTDLTEKYH